MCGRCGQGKREEESGARGAVRAVTGCAEKTVRRHTVMGDAAGEAARAAKRSGTA
jgi:hypothetical protein